MARYTTTIKDILQTQAGDEANWTPGEVYLLAKDTLFSPEVLGTIDERYRQHFVTSFAYHYFLDEIGLETFGLWKFRLAGRVYENASYINNIYETIDREIFSEYRVIKRDGNIKDTGNTNDKTTGTVSRDITNVGDSSADSEITSGGEQTTTNDLQNKTTYNSQQKNTGTTTQTRSGNDSTALSGTDTNKEFGKEINDHDGFDKETQNGTRTSDRHGKQISTQTGSYADNVNEMVLHSDTPMGSLENMRTPNDDASGKGVSYATGANKEYNYLSDAQERDHTTKRTYDDYKNETSFDNYGETESFQGYERRSDYDSSNTLSFQDRKSEQTYGRTDTTTYNSSNEQIDDTTSARTGDDVEKQTGTQKVVTTQKENGVSTEEHTDKTTDITTHDVNKAGNRDLTKVIDEDVIDYKISYELLLKTEPLMSKIWDLFDTLFILVY